MNKKEIIERLNSTKMLTSELDYKDEDLKELQAYRYIMVHRTNNRTIISINRGKNFAEAVKEYLDQD